MALVLLAAFIAVPVIEIALFIEIGGWIGLWTTGGRADRPTRLRRF